MTGAELEQLPIRHWCRTIHRIAKEKGWWEEEERNIGELIALVHSELSEAFEEWREGREVTYLEDDGKPCGFASELADVVIRIMDMCQGFGINLEEEMMIKVLYNERREYRHGGKKA